MCCVLYAGRTRRGMEKIVVGHQLAWRKKMAWVSLPANGQSEELKGRCPSSPIQTRGLSPSPQDQSRVYLDPANQVFIFLMLNN